MFSFFTYERRIVGTALLAVIPLAGAAALLVWAGDFQPVVLWTIVLLIVSTIGIATFALREVIVYPLRTLANLISAIREEDYSIRAREASEGKKFGEVMWELNALSSAMRQRHLAALEAAALVRTVIAEVDAAIFAFDPHSRLELVNRAGERLLGQNAEELLGKSADEIALHDRPGWSIRTSTFRREGETHQLVVMADIRRALRQEEIRAWQRLVRVLGHELNNSLAPIKSIAGSLEEDLAKGNVNRDDLTRGLDIIARRAESLTRFLSVYSQMARLPEPKLRSVDLGALVTRVAALDRRISVAIAGGPPVHVEADEDQLEQVVINLLKNAIDAALETGGGVTVSWTADGELHIVDEGPGLASTSNLFVPFFTTKPGGSGIGLVLSRQIAEAHGGSLLLRNREDGGGCEAVLRLPRS